MSALFGIFFAFLLTGALLTPEALAANWFNWSQGKKATKTETKGKQAPNPADCDTLREEYAGCLKSDRAQTKGDNCQGERDALSANHCPMPQPPCDEGSVTRRLYCPDGTTVYAEYVCYDGRGVREELRDWSECPPAPVAQGFHCIDTDNSEPNPTAASAGRLQKGTTFGLLVLTPTSREDRCDEDGRVVEHFCDADNLHIGTQIHPCAGGEVCQEGACVARAPEPPPEPSPEPQEQQPEARADESPPDNRVCIDPDGELQLRGREDIYVKSTTSGFDRPGGNYITREDSCEDRSALREQTCSGDTNQVVAQIVPCRCGVDMGDCEICHEGACLPPCVDSDVNTGGGGIFVRGTVRGLFGGRPPLRRDEDSCPEHERPHPTSVYEYSCSGRYSSTSSRIPCPENHLCVEGRCIEHSENRFREAGYCFDADNTDPFQIGGNISVFSGEDRHIRSRAFGFSFAAGAVVERQDECVPYANGSILLREYFCQYRGVGSTNRELRSLDIECPRLEVCREGRCVRQ